MRIGIFGGTFNPPHNMHQHIATELLATNTVDKVIFLPDGPKYPKPGLIAYKHRYNMVKQMIEGMKNVEVSDLERQKNYYTYEVLAYFQQQYPTDTIYFIMGTDNLNELDTWKNYETILKNYFLLIIKRNKDNVNIIKQKYPNDQHHIKETVIETKAISSTQVRRDLAVAKPTLINPKVYDYIKQHALYQPRKEKEK